MSTPTVDESRTTDAAPRSAPVSTVAETVPPMASDELEAIAQLLARRFPDVPGTYVRYVVESTYRELARTARIHSHLIPLTLNLSRSRLAQDDEIGETP